MTQLILCFLVTISVSIQACTRNPHENQNIIDFERVEDLDAFGWKCHSKFSICSQYKSHGTKSLKMEFYPTSKVGFSTSRFQHCWNFARTFEFNVFNPVQKGQTLYIMISDNFTNDNPLHSFVKMIAINPGENKIVIPLSQLKDRTNRKLNLKSIAGFYIYMENISDRTVLYFDYFHLG